MELEPGMQVRLKSLGEVNRDDPPSIAPEMDEYFGRVVTISSDSGSSRDFQIQEDGDEYFYSQAWIEEVINDNGVRIPKSIQRMV